MSRIRRGNHVLMTFVGDHGPRHVHVYRDDRLAPKWDLDRWRPLSGSATRRIRRYLEELKWKEKL